MSNPHRADDGGLGLDGRAVRPVEGRSCGRSRAGRFSSSDRAAVRSDDLQSGDIALGLGAARGMLRLRVVVGHAGEAAQGKPRLAGVDQVLHARHPLLKGAC